MAGETGFTPRQLIGILLVAVILGILAGAIAAGRLRFHVPW